MPLLSVLLPIRNAAHTLPAALSSLTRQTHREWECLAVDDGSSDASPQILADWQRRDPRIRVIRQAALGLVPALQRAAQEARGAWLARMDADDLCHSERFAAQLHHMQAEPRLGALGCRVRHFPRRGLGRGLQRYERWLNLHCSTQAIARNLFVEAPLAHPSVMLRRAAFEQVGGYRDLPWPEDYDLWLRLAAAGWQLARLPQTLLLWRHGPGRTSFVDPRYSPDAFTRVKAHFLAPRLQSHGRPLAVWGAGPVGRRLVRALRSEDVEVAHLIDIHPGRLGQRIAGLPVSAPAFLLEHPELFVLAAVQRPGARASIAGFLERAGRQHGDWLPVA